MKPRHYIGAAISIAVLAIWCLVAMCKNKYLTKEWWPQ